jgi:hypothetical protein
MKAPHLALLCATAVASSSASPAEDWPVELASRFSEAAISPLSAATVADQFRPVIDIRQFSRGACAPVLKATEASVAPIAGSLIATAAHKPCEKAGRIVVLRFQFALAPDSLAKEYQRARDAFLEANGTPCLDGDDHGSAATYWSDSSRALAIIEKVDVGTGFTISYFNRAAVSPPVDEGDADVYKFWNGALPSACKEEIKPRPT